MRAREREREFQFWWLIKLFVMVLFMVTWSVYLPSSSDYFDGLQQIIIYGWMKMHVVLGLGVVLVLVQVV